LGSDGTHQGLRQERELSDERLDAKPKNAGDGRCALHDDAHHGARANRSALGGERALRYTNEPMKNEWRFDNPLGFQVIEYRKDQESVIPATTGPTTMKRILCLASS